MCIIDVMIPVWNPDERLRQSVESLLRQSCKPRKITLVFSIDKTWDDRRVERWFANNKERVEIIKIPRSEFNHGGTRHWWARFDDADYLLFLVQDAVPENKELIRELAESLENTRHAVAYARQIPGFGCDEIEEYTRYFNYPSYSLKKTKAKFIKGGVKDCFTSNVCAMYRKDWYDKIGGFEEHILLSEDSVYAAKALLAGADVIYNADARVVHAHDFGYSIQWKRNFDIGVVHKMYSEIFGRLSSEKEGIELVKGTALHLLKKRRLLLLPRLFCLSAVKFLGYQAGKRYDKLSVWLVKKWSWDQYYWRRNEDGR